MLINTFIDYFASVLGRSPRTCTEYEKELRFFASWLEPDLSAGVDYPAKYIHVNVDGYTGISGVTTVRLPEVV